MRMITSVEDCELHENIEQNVSIYELLRNDIEGKEMGPWIQTPIHIIKQPVSYQAMKIL
jgi:hypothetical protein